MLRRVLNLEDGGHKKHQNRDGGEVALIWDTLGEGGKGCLLGVGGLAANGLGLGVNPGKCRGITRWVAQCCPTPCPGIAVAPPHPTPLGPTHQAGTVQSRSHHRAGGDQGPGQG